VFDPQTGTVTTQPVGWDMFCNGMVVLLDGRAFIYGGTLQYDAFHGELRSSVYDLTTGAFTDVQSMAHGRWYPTVTTLGDGTVMTFSGLSEGGGTNTSIEIYSVSTGWSAQIGSPFTPPLYPRMHLLPNGKVLYSGSTTQSRLFDPAAKTWSGVIATTNYGGTRTYGTSVLLPLSPANNYKPMVMIMGGGSPSTATTELIDLSPATPKWTTGPSMSQPRIEMNATILPNGKILALGGSLNDEDTGTASLNADLYDPATNTFSSASQNAFARPYHSNALLLPDGTVWFAGGNPARGTYEQHMEIYSPAVIPRRQPEFELAGDSRQRDLQDSRHFRGHTDGHRQCRSHRSQTSFAAHHGKSRARFQHYCHAFLARRIPGERHQLHGYDYSRERLFRHREFLGKRFALRRECFVHAINSFGAGDYDAECYHFFVYSGGQLHAQNHRINRLAQSQHDCKPDGDHEFEDAGRVRYGKTHRSEFRTDIPAVLIRRIPGLRGDDPRCDQSG